MEVLVRKHFWVIHLVLIALGAGFLARAVAHLVEASFFSGWEPPKVASRPRPPAPPPPSKDDMPILQRNIFCSTCPPIIPVPTASAGEAPSGPVRTSLPLRLVATGLGQGPRDSIAIICDTTTRACGAFSVTSKIGEAEVLEINARRVDLNVSGRIEYMELEGQGGGAPQASQATPEPMPAASYGGDEDPMAKDLEKGVKKVSDNDFRISRDLLEKVLSDTSSLARSARIVPSMKDGKANGFTLYAVRPGGVYERIGLRTGDTVHAINGYDMSSPDKALEVYTKLRRASHLSVSITRAGQPKTLDYTIQ